MSEAYRVVGIDVSKARLDVAFSAAEVVVAFSNDGTGHEALLQRLRTFSPTLVVMEASGGYEVAVAARVGAAGHPVVVANARQVRDFARCTGRLATPPST